MKRVTQKIESGTGWFKDRLKGKENTKQSNQVSDRPGSKSRLHDDARTNRPASRAAYHDEARLNLPGGRTRYQQEAVIETAREVTITPVGRPKLIDIPPRRARPIPQSEEPQRPSLPIYMGGAESTQGGRRNSPGRRTTRANLEGYE
ncbi:MAG: hypothetical protein Q9218_008152 [Villophora microphyllina]